MATEGEVRHIIGRLWPVFCERLDEMVQETKDKEYASEDEREGVLKGLEMARSAFPGYFEGIMTDMPEPEDDGHQTTSWNPLHRFRRAI